MINLVPRVFSPTEMTLGTWLPNDPLFKVFSLKGQCSLFIVWPWIKVLFNRKWWNFPFSEWEQQEKSHQSKEILAFETPARFLGLGRCFWGLKEHKIKHPPKFDCCALRKTKVLHRNRLKRRPYLDYSRLLTFARRSIQRPSSSLACHASRLEELWNNECFRKCSEMVHHLWGKHCCRSQQQMTWMLFVDIECKWLKRSGRKNVLRRPYQRLNKAETMVEQRRLRVVTVKINIGVAPSHRHATLFQWGLDAWLTK